MAAIEISQVCKDYHGGVRAVHHVDIDIRDGEFIVLVGPPAAASPRYCVWLPASRIFPRVR